MMKPIFCLFIFLLFFHFTKAQLKTTPVCPVVSVDVLEGTVNDMYPFSTPGEIQKKFPCFTSVVEETNGSTCGAVIYKDRDVSFITERDYIEIGEHFKGTLSVQLLGADRSNLFKLLGNPQVKDDKWDAYQTKYGVLILYYNNAGKINKFQISSKNAQSIKLCE